MGPGTTRSRCCGRRRRSRTRCRSSSGRPQSSSHPTSCCVRSCSRPPARGRRRSSVRGRSASPPSARGRCSASAARRRRPGTGGRRPGPTVAGVPAIDPHRYKLLIHGMVERPTVFDLAALRRFPAVSRLYFLECSGNGAAAYRGPRPDLTPQIIDGLTSTSEWTGVPLATLFREVGVKPGAKWFLAEGEDAAVMSRSIPVEKAWDDALIAYGQNGEPLRPEQGYPARLLVPGWEGSANVKWIRRIELADRPFMTREETAKYTDPLPNGTARMSSFVMDAKSIITSPAYPAALPERGWWEIRGLAWSGRGRVTRVDVSTDAGKTWAAAELQEPVLPKCHTRFRLPWNWDGREAMLMSRAVDETGYLQPTLAELRKVRGPGAPYHFNNIRAWRVRGDGAVQWGLEA